MNLQTMNEKRIFELHEDVCKVLGHLYELRLLTCCKKKEMCFTDILEVTGGLKSNLSQHLSIMTEKGILITRK